MAKPRNLTPAEIAERTLPAMALIKTDLGLGSGFVVGPQGRVATNLHVISGAHQATVVLSDEHEYDEVEVLASDPAHDLVVLRVQAKTVTPLALGDSEHVQPGQQIVAIGHPLGLGNTVSNGLVSAVREIQPNLVMLQVSAPISPGSSGGPLLNEQGEVIGISTFVFSAGQNLNFGMPVNYLKAILGHEHAMTFAQFIEAQESLRPKRRVPRHDLDLLTDCTNEDLEHIEKSLAGAIGVGVPLFNGGNAEACYRVYEDAALEIDRELKTCAGPRRALLDGVKNAGDAKEFAAKAWAMRDAFDGLLEVIARRLARDSAAPPQDEAGPGRHVPHHELSVLDGCSAHSIERLTQSMASAIEVGAPLYNQKNPEACYRVYEGAALEMTRVLKGCKGIKKALTDGVDRARKETTFEQKAWAMRDTFDGIIDLVDRKLRRPSISEPQRD